MLHPLQGLTHFIHQQNESNDYDIHEETEYEYVLKHSGSFINPHHQRNSKTRNQAANADHAREYLFKVAHPE